MKYFTIKYYLQISKGSSILNNANGYNKSPWIDKDAQILLILIFFIRLRGSPYQPHILLTGFLGSCDKNRRITSLYFMSSTVFPDIHVISCPELSNFIGKIYYTPKHLGT